MGKSWGKNTGKIQPFIQRREGRRISPDVDGTAFPTDKSCDKSFDNPFPDREGIRMPGQKELLSPEQKAWYLSQWNRYERGRQLDVDKVEELEENQSRYWFYSCHAFDQYWKVTRIVTPPPELYNLLMKNFLTVLCPVPYRIDESIFETDAPAVTWSQVAGNRTVVFDDPNLIYPAFDIQSNCTTSGCSDDSPSPIILRVTDDSDSTNFADLTIFNTPTSLHDNYSIPATIKRVQPELQVNTTIFTPEYRFKAYKADSEPVTLTWIPPTLNSEYITEYVWQSNTTGSYIVESSHLPSAREKEVIDGRYYRIVSVYDVLGYRYSVPSELFIFDLSGLVFADDTYESQGSIKLGTTQYNRARLQVIFRTELDTSESVGSIGGLKEEYNRVTLNTIRRTEVDISESVGSISNGTSSYTVEQLGGIVIG